MGIDKLTKEIMANEIDLKILGVLINEDYSLTELAKEVGIAYKNLLPHVRKLEKAGWLKTEKKKKTRGQKVIIVSSGRYETTGVGKFHQKWRDLFKGKIGKKADKDILEVIEQLGKKARHEAISYLTDITATHAWEILTSLYSKGYVQAKFELTKEGKEYLEQLKKKYGKRN
jgi:predicted transcriptional regulator